MRKPLVSRMMTMTWLSTVTVQSLLITAVVLGPLFTPISLASALKLNGTTSAPPSTPAIVVNAISEERTTVASFLQPENSETTLNSQADELTTTLSSSPLAKRHSSIHASGTGESSSSNRGSPRFLSKAFTNSAESDSHSSSKEKPQRNGIGAVEEEGELSASVGLTTAEQTEGDDDADNTLPSTTARDNDSGGGVSVSTNSLGADEAASTSLDKDESGAYFSGGEDGETNANGDEGDSAANDDDFGGETATEDIFPPDDNTPIDSDESVAATTYASLLRSPNPTEGAPQSFSAQLAMKLGRAPGTNRKNNRLGTRGLSSKSELNALSPSSITQPPPTSQVPPSTTTTTTTTPSPTTTNSLSSNSNITDSIVEDNVASDSSSDGSVVIIERVDSNRRGSSNNNNDSSGNNPTSFELTGSRFHSRSNINTAQSSTSLLRPRPTPSVISHSSSTHNHNNNLHNRIIKRKKAPFGRGNVTTGGSSLSSIYNNSILTSTSSSTKVTEVEVSTTTTVPTLTSSSDALLENRSSGVDVDASSTESNSLLNASQNENSSNSSVSVSTEFDVGKPANESSPALTSGADSSHNLTTPAVVTSSENNTSEADASNNSNSSSPLSSSRAILGFGPSSVQSSHGKVKRPKPIIIRDHDESLYINNISENTAGSTTEHATGKTSQAGLQGDETATSSVGVAGEDDTNRPVGSNALPTPPFKIRRVKINSRRISSTSSRTTTSNYDVTSVSTTPLPSVIEASTQEIVQSPISSTNSLKAEAASGATDYSQLHDVIKPTLTREDEPPVFSSRRVFKEEFGVTHHSYGDNNEDDDERGGNNEEELQATTEYFPYDNTTPYPISMGVRSRPTQEEESVIDNDDPGKFHVGRSSGEAENNQRYRDYYSDIVSSNVDYGTGGGNLHIKSDVDDKSPVTVTVTHTVVQSTPQITSTAIPTHEDAEQSKYGSNDGVNKADHANKADSDESERDGNPNLHPTPALPSSIFVSPTPTLSNFASGQGPFDFGITPTTSEDVQFSTSHFGISSGEIHSHQYDSNNDKDDSSEGNDQKDKQENNDEQHSTPALPQSVQPTPIISTKGIKSVYFTQVEHPHFTSSSYEFSTSTMYSYTFPDHDSMHMTTHDDDDHPDHEHDDDEHHHDVTPYTPYEEEHPSTHSQSERRNTPETEINGTTISDGTSYTPNPSSPEFGNLTKSSSSQVPVKTEQETTGMAPTPSIIDVDIYPPLESGPGTSVVDAASSPVVTPSSGSSRAPGSLEDNEISEEELRKLQQQNGSTGFSSTTTTRPFLSGPGGVTNGKDKFKVVEGGDDDHSSSKDDDSKVPSDTEKSGNSSKNDSSESTKTTSKPHSEGDAPKQESTGNKTPFGKGESFGIGNVHVPIMVQMVLDVAQPEFCSHINSFKTMVATVYETQRDVKVDPEQIVIYTEPGCDQSSKSEESTGHNYTENSTDASLITTTAKPGKLQSTSKGTYPLTSPPPPGGREDEASRKSRSGKDFESATSSTKNSTGPSESSLDKATSDSNKSDSSEINLESAPRNKQLHGMRSRRSTKMATTAAATRNSNFSEDIKATLVDNGNSNANESLFTVFFYVNDKEGNYDQNLTSSFVRHWNESLRLNNVGGDDSNATLSNGNNESSFDNEIFKRVKKVGMVAASHLVASPGSSDENSGIIVAITVASVVAVCLFLLGVGLLVMRHRQSQTKFAKRCTPVTLDDYSLDNISVYNSFRRKQRLRGSKRSYTNAAFDDHTAPSRPVNATVLASCVNDAASLENEFRAIPNITATLDDIPNGAETKNRYANVIPMPDTRVLLTFLEDVPNSDYINANYVRGVAGEQKRYIITQGPLEDTIVDFWRMVWEQQVRVVFMLTDFAEGGIAKCAEYYPRSETIDCSQLHGDFQITLEKRDISDNCITSYLVLKDMERNLRRDIVHFWYHSWPEKGVPASPKMTIDFLHRSRKFTKDPVPVVVHCSPGTGRSGTIVACDIAMKEYDAQNTVDIPRLVLRIRQDRAGAVQTKEQYNHIYQVLHSHASRIGGSHLESI